MTEPLETKRLRLVLQSTEDIRAHIASLSPADRAQVSPAWLARMESATTANAWTHGFWLNHRETGESIGTAGFKGPPTDGVVEIAYGVSPEQEGKGYATEAAAALTTYAFETGKVRLVIAHTLPEKNASTRVLTKCGFKFAGEVTDPEDGLVWRWESVRNS